MVGIAIHNFPYLRSANFLYMQQKFKRILLKLSGESLIGNSGFGLDPDILTNFATEIKSVHDVGVEVAIVIGGGNIYRGMNESETGIE